MKGLIYVLIILFVGAVGGYLVTDKIDEWRAGRATSPSTTTKPEDLTSIVTQMLNRERSAYQNHDADLLLNDCASNYSEVNGDTGESMDLARARLFYHEYFKNGQAVEWTIDAPQIFQYPNALVVEAGYKKTSNAYGEQKIQGFKGHGTWVFVRQNSIWRLASYAWSENPF